MDRLGIAVIAICLIGLAGILLMTAGFFLWIGRRKKAPGQVPTIPVILMVTGGELILFAGAAAVVAAALK